MRSHDTWFEVDPQSGVPLLWVANVHWGIIAYDVSDPANPVVAELAGIRNHFEGILTGERLQWGPHTLSVATGRSDDRPVGWP